MCDELWQEIADAPGEIFDIPEMREFSHDDDDKASFESYLESSYDF